jgi:hypothetical protein
LRSWKSGQQLNFKEIYADVWDARKDNFSKITETSFEIALKDEIEHDDLKFKGPGVIMSNTGGFSSFVFFVFSAAFTSWMTGMRFQHQAQ